MDTNIKKLARELFSFDPLALKMCFDDLHESTKEGYRASARYVDKLLDAARNEGAAEERERNTLKLMEETQKLREILMMSLQSQAKD